MKQIIQKFGMMVAMLPSFLSVSAYDFEVNGKWYNVISLDYMTCELTYSDSNSSYSGIIDVPSSVEYNGRTFVVKKIGNGAFSGAKSLTTVNLPETIVQIGSYAFDECESLERINLPNSITAIGGYAFNKCYALSAITFPTKLKEISNGTFAYCKSLTEISIPARISSIGGEAFAYSGIERCVIEDGKSEIKLSGTYIVQKDGIVSYTKSGTFSNSNIRYLYLGRNYSRKIGDSINKFYSPFLNLESLEEVIIGRFVNKMPINSFVKVIKCIDHGTFYTPDYELLPNLSRITVEDGVGEVVFITETWGGWNANDIEYSISDYGSIKTLVLKRNIDWITNIGNFNYSLFKKIEEAHLIGQFSSINDYFFKGCSNLSYLELGENVSSAGKDVFASTKNLLKIDIHSEIPITFGGSSGFSNNQFLHTEIYVPKTSKESYKSAEVWKNFWNIKEMDYSGVEDVTEDDVNVKVVDGAVVAEGCGEMEIYSISGQIVYRGAGSADNLAPGIYAVRAGGKTVKVIVGR